MGQGIRLHAVLLPRLLLLLQQQQQLSSVLDQVHLQMGGVDTTRVKDVSC
jgi:hypothetical protein